jgi:DNA-binding PadR family transcriptional regulator
MDDLTAFQRDLLYVVGGLDSPHGLAIKEELEEYYESEVHHGRLYPNLDALVSQGLISKGQKDRRTNVYALTAQGQTTLEDRRAWENSYLSAADLLAS